MGSLIVIEGCDGSGKATQALLLEEALLKMDYKTEIIDFPCYEQDSSLFVRQYLAGEFGSRAEDVNCYAASMFYALDRYICFKRSLSDKYNEGTVFVSNRYTTSNAVHQMQKLNKEEWDSYLEWLFDFEYSKLSLPIPDLVIYLDIPSLVSERMILDRYNGDHSRMDIHERDIEFQRRSREAALYCAKKEGWRVVNCSDRNDIRSRQSIADEIFGCVIDLLNLNKNENNLI